MTVELAETVLQVAAAYLAIGGLFALLFVAVGLRHVDPLAAEGPLRFKVLIAPGIVALWPVLLVRWLASPAKVGK